MSASGWSVVRTRDREGLTPRERQCVDLERRGFPRASIATLLGLRVATVAVHLWNAGQLGVRLRKPLRTYHRWTARERREGRRTKR